MKFEMDQKSAQSINSSQNGAWHQIKRFLLGQIIYVDIYTCNKLNFFVILDKWNHTWVVEPESNPTRYESIKQSVKAIFKHRFLPHQINNSKAKLHIYN